jgi:hypothetical protein
MKFKHALTCATAALVLVAATGCSPAAEAPSADPAPTSGAPPAPEAAPLVPADDQSAGFGYTSASEEQRLKDFPEAAKREGGVLTLFTRGTPVASFTDASSPWAFTGVLKTLGPTGERLFFRVTETYTDDDGRTEWIEHWFDPAGQLIPSSRVVGQNPGRTMIAAGYYEGGDVGVDPDLSLMDWSSEPKLVYKFKSPCYPVKWISNDELEAACPYAYTGNTPESDEIIPARVVRAGPREWRLQQVGLPTRNMPNPPQKAPFDETVTAAEIAPDPEYEAALSKTGYLRLDR